MKILTVPRSKDAMNRLDYDKNIEGDLIELYLETSAFNELWKTKIFKEINSSLNIIIDICEDEKIEFNKLKTAKAVVIRHVENSEATLGLIMLLGMINLAEKYETGLFFYF